MKTYRRKEVEQITGIPARRIQFYTDNGLVLLDKLNTGRGKERLYSKNNLFELLLIKELSKHKIELSKIKKIMFDVPKEVDRWIIDKMLDAKTHEVGIILGNYIIIYENGDIQYSFNVDMEHPKIDSEALKILKKTVGGPKTLKAAKTIEYDTKTFTFSPEMLEALKTIGIDPETYKKLNTIEINMEKQSSCLVINISNLAAQLAEV